MAYNVRFLRGASSSYSAIPVEQRDSQTFYYTTDDNQLYIGNVKLSNGADLEAAVVRVATNEGEIKAIKEALGTLTLTSFNELKAKVEANEGAISALQTGKADKATTLSGYGIKDAYTKTEIDSKIEDLETIDTGLDSRLTQAEKDIDAIEADYLKAADKTALQEQITANANAIELLTENLTTEEVDSIKELVDYVNEHGAEVTGMKEATAKAQKAADDAQKAADDAQAHSEGVASNLAEEIANRGTAIEGLQTQITNVKTTADAAATQTALQEEINRATGVESGLNTRLQTIENAVGETGSVSQAIESAKQEAINEASTDATNKANTAKTEAIASANAHTDEEVAKITLTTGSANGTVAFKGEDVAVKGLGSAAYAVAEAFDVAGSADNAKTEAINEAALDATNKANAAKAGAISEAAADATNKAEAAETNAKAYTDTALTWGTIA